MFKKLFSNLANDLVRMLLAAIKKFGMESVEYYHTNMFNSNAERLTFQTVQIKYVSNLLCDINKATGIDNLSGTFLKDGADIFTMPITQIAIYPSNSATFRKTI